MQEEPFLSVAAKECTWEGGGGGCRETAGFSRGGAREVTVKAPGLHGQITGWDPSAAALF